MGAADVRGLGMRASASRAISQPAGAREWACSGRDYRGIRDTTSDPRFFLEAASQICYASDCSVKEEKPRDTGDDPEYAYIRLHPHRAA